MASFGYVPTDVVSPRQAYTVWPNDALIQIEPSGVIHVRRPYS